MPLQATATCQALDRVFSRRGTVARVCEVYGMLRIGGGTCLQLLARQMRAYQPHDLRRPQERRSGQRMDYLLHTAQQILPIHSDSLQYSWRAVIVDVATVSPCGTPSTSFLTTCKDIIRRCHDTTPHWRSKYANRRQAMKYPRRCRAHKSRGTVGATIPLQKSKPLCTHGTGRLWPRAVWTELFSSEESVGRDHPPAFAAIERNAVLRDTSRPREATR
ncbi:hypothetical protein GY45DRAFT_822001 [Cubamyces sp. BRFM 1775]|nr:hypothetical protein GY45DRAFT_822001 [Cubamyces sp. BRFM 1775]